MKTIGLIGGMSWESSIEYYRIINEEISKRLGRRHSCKCIMYSVDFDEIAELQFKDDWDALRDIMIDAGRKLKAGGADFIVICTNTMHKFTDEIEESTGIPVLHISDATGEKIKSEGINKVALLGTKFTMEQDFYKERLRKKHGIEVIIPDEAERNLIHKVIYDELVVGIIKEESKREFIKIIDRLVLKGAGGIVLGCTEIPLLVKQGDVAVKLFDTTAIHAEAAVEAALRAERQA